jgi:ubiquinone/menaquinone biosynthesis C-methylase UbiE
MKRKFSEGLLNDKAILENLDIQMGQTTLDAGCGNGYMSKKFSKLVGNTGKVFALDTDKASIDILKKQVEKSNIITLVGDITQRTELEDRSLDLVYLSTVFHIFKIQQIEGFIKEIKRILKSKAQLAIVNINKEETGFGPSIEIRSSPEDLKQKLPFIPRGLFEVGEHFYMQLFENI